jgi:hypothetical protein
METGQAPEDAADADRIIRNMELFTGPDDLLALED